MIDAYQESALTGGGDCFIHWHSADRVMRREDWSSLEELNWAHEVTGTYTVTNADNILLCPSGGTITLPLSKAGREFEVVMTGTTNVTVQFTSTDLIYGASSVLLNLQGMALHFKAVSGGWVLI